MTTPEPNLHNLEFSAKVDYVTIETAGKRALPKLIGRPHWVASEHYKKLSVHDLAPEDLQSLSLIFPDGRISEIEVAIDARVSSKVDDRAVRAKCLESYYAWVATHLYPYHAPHMSSRTSAYDPADGKLKPFNFRVPSPSEQLLYGFRNDAAQVKVYRKTVDNHIALTAMQESVRIEVRAGQQVCQELGLHNLRNLHGFAFRSLLSAYFWMAASAAPRHRRLSKVPIQNVVRDYRRKAIQREASAAWERSGVQGAIVVPGMHIMRIKPHRLANQRFGKALQRLQERFSRERFILAQFASQLMEPCLGAIYDACMDQRVAVKKALQLPFCSPPRSAIVIRA